MTLETQALGKAYLVGAGPGDPELLTLKAKRILSDVDVILYDYLVDSRILAWCREDAELIYVGKSGVTGHTMTQEEIEDLMIDVCQQGKSLCRLKGGDPYVFGRGAEEGERLFAKGIPFEVIPGISSALAAPLYAGIPVTHRSFASSVSIITGHEDPTKPESMLNWEAIAGMSGTLVFLMGVKQLPNIVAALKAHGRSVETPVALVRWGTRPEQETLTGTIATIVELVEQHDFKPPCVIVVGDVVTARPALNWYENTPLFGKTIAITRARHQVSTLRSELECLGASVVEFPTIAIEPTKEPQKLREGLEKLNQYDWTVFTSPNGVAHVMGHLFDMGLDSRHFGRCQVASIGPATAEKLKEYGVLPDLMPKVFVAESIFETFQEKGESLEGKKFLLPRADIARENLVELLESAGAQVDQVPAYHTVMATEGDDIEALVAQLSSQAVDVITFSSSSTVTNFQARLASVLEATPALLDYVKLASIGPITGETLEACLGRVDIQADVHTIPGLVEAIVAHYESERLVVSS